MPPPRKADVARVCGVLENLELGGNELVSLYRHPVLDTGSQGLSKGDDIAIAEQVRNDEMPLVPQYLSALVPSKRIAFTKPSRGTSDSERRTIINGNRAFRFDCERCRLMRGAAFTLAEVLITLGIIGVVAAMTMPVLIQNHQKSVVETRLKKFYSVMNQAILMSKNDNGDPIYWDNYFLGTIYDEKGHIINRTDDADAAFEKYLAPYLKIVEKRTVTDSKNQKRILYYLVDGSALAFPVHTNRDIYYFPKNAEKCITTDDSIGKCSFAFIFFPNNTESYWKYHYNKGMEPFLCEWDGQEESLYNDSTYGCAKGYGDYCTAIIMHNGWKIPKDYPKKIKF